MAFVVLIAAVSGCGDGESSDLPPAFTIENYGGYASVLMGNGYAIGVGNFYSDVDPESARNFQVSALGTDKCRQLNDEEDLAVYTQASLGSAITFTAGSTAIIAEEQGVDGFYQSDNPVTAAPADADYVLTNAGNASIPAQTIATFHVPKHIGFTGPATIVPGSPLDLTFTPDTGADQVSIWARNADQTVGYYCGSKDDGTFTLSADITSAVGASGTIKLQATTWTKASFNGHDLLMYGSTF